MYLHPDLSNFTSNSSSERVMPMELSVHREISFRSRQIERGQSLQATTELEFPNPNSPDPPPAMLDSLLRDRELTRKRLREATRNLARSRTDGVVIPMELAMQREMAFRSRMEATDVSEKGGLEGSPLPQCRGEVAQASPRFQEKVRDLHLCLFNSYHM